MQWNFWKWLIKGLKTKPGISKFLDFWLCCHVIVSIFLAYWIDTSPQDAASTLILPLASIFIGLSFAWAGNAQALLREAELESLVESHPDGLENYVYTFQLAILVILITLASWGLAGLGFFEKPPFSGEKIKFVVESILYFLASITLRECWHVVLGSQIMIITRYNIRKKQANQKDKIE